MYNNNIHTKKTQIFMKIFDKKIISLITGAVFIALILKNIDVNKSLEAVKHLNFFYVLLMIPAYYCAFLFRALRWKTILSGKKEIKLTSFLNSLLRGWLVNCVVPARGGELYRAHFFGKKEDLSRVTILASIVLERIFDGLILFLILFLLASFVYSSKKFFGIAVAAGIIFVGTFLSLLLISKFYKNAFIKEKFKKFFAPTPNTRIKNFLSKILNKITGTVNSFINGLEIFNSPVLILKTFFITLLVWLCEGLSLFMLIKGFGYSIGILGSLIVLSIIAFISLIPAGPGSLGTLQWGFIIALGFFNISRETAFAVSVISQLFSVITVSLGSLFFMATDHFDLKEKDYTSLEN